MNAEKTCGNCKGEGSWDGYCGEDVCSQFSRWQPIEARNSVEKAIEDGRINVLGNAIEAKQTAGKLDLTLVPNSLIRAVATIREYGIAKYGERDNWKKVPVEEYKKALYLHFLSALDGEEFDEESGLPHFWHIATNCAFIIQLEGEQNLTLINADGKSCVV